MNTVQICPLCGNGVLQTRNYSRDMVHKGVNLSVEGLMYDYCPACEAELTSPEQMDHNAKLIRAAFVGERARLKREHNLLSGLEIRTIRESLGITQKQAAKIFGGGPTAFAKYEAEEVVQSIGMDKLLRVTAAVPAAAKWLCDYAGEKIKLSAHTQRLQGLPIGALSKEKTPLTQLFSADGGIKVGRFDLKDAASSTANDKDYANAA